jgi:hypothetical protein
MWEHIIKMEIKETRWQGIVRIHQTLDRAYLWAVVNTLMNLHIL